MLFDIAGQKYALALEDVVEVIWMVALTSTPAHHDHIEGVINLRGTILPILNLRRMLNLPPTTYGLNHRILVVRTGERTLGFVVDAVAQVEEYTREQVDAPREFDMSLSFVNGLIKQQNQIIFCVDLSKLISANDVSTAAEMTQRVTAAISIEKRTT